MLEIKNLSFSYGTHRVLEHIDLKVKAGDFVALTGVSGSGKSTLLKLIYGSVAPNEGELSWKKRPLLGPDYNLLPGADFMRYLAQDFDLMPFTTVAENISQHLSVFDPEALEHRTEELLALINMKDFAQTKVKLLSGGQQQRVALAKVLAKAPELLLIDEPFSHIDVPQKQQLREQLYAYLKKHKISCLMATHDPEDFMGHAQQMICLAEGMIEASGVPQKLYEAPPSGQVAGLFGRVNLLSPKELKSWNIPGELTKKNLNVWPHEGHFQKQQPQSKGKISITAAVKSCVFKGTHYLISLSVPGRSKWIHLEQKRPLKENSTGYIWLSMALCQKRTQAIKSQ